MSEAESCDDGRGSGEDTGGEEGAGVTSIAVSCGPVSWPGPEEGGSTLSDEGGRSELSAVPSGTVRLPSSVVGEVSTSVLPDGSVT